MSPPLIPAMAIQAVWTFATLTRQVSVLILGGQVSLPHEHGKFMSLQMTVEQAFNAVAAVCSALLITEGPNHTMIGMDRISLVFLAGTPVVPLLFYVTRREIRARDARLAALGSDPAAAIASPALEQSA